MEVVGEFGRISRRSKLSNPTRQQRGRASQPWTCCVCPTGRRACTAWDSPAVVCRPTGSPELLSPAQGLGPGASNPTLCSRTPGDVGAQGSSAYFGPMGLSLDVAESVFLCRLTLLSGQKCLPTHKSFHLFRGTTREPGREGVGQGLKSIVH